MKIAPVADVKARFSKYLKDCVEGPVVVTKNGRPAAVLVAVSDEEELERLILAHTHHASRPFWKPQANASKRRGA